MINAFALGPWATGMNVSMSSVDVAILKSTGPDIGKIEKTLRLFGPRYRYLVCGYPPFLKTLVDTADVDWGGLECFAAVGGEGMSEALRSHLERSFRRVYSSFGASDLEINIAAENELTIALRRLLAERPDLARALELPEQPTLPMVFQYNPLDYLVETTAGGELVITVNRVGTTAPKLRYNLHDLGCSVPFRRLRVGAVRRPGSARPTSRPSGSICRCSSTTAAPTRRLPSTERTSRPPTSRRRSCPCPSSARAPARSRSSPARTRRRTRR